MKASRSVRRANHRAAAFSLAELAMVLAILAITMAIAQPRFSAYFRNSRLRDATNRVVADILLTQSEALKLQQTVTLAYSVETSSYGIIGMEDPDHAGHAYLVELGDPLYAAELLEVDFGGQTKVAFDRYGAPSDAGKIVVANTTHQFTIRVRPGSGKVNVLSRQPRP